jgi:hypothetical protein
MKSKGKTFATDVLRLALHCDGHLEVALHSGEIDGNSVEQNEVVYSGYSRAIAPAQRNYWSIAGNRADNVVAIVFPACLGGQAKATHVSISQNGMVKYHGELKAPLDIREGIAPFIKPGGLVIVEQ